MQELIPFERRVIGSKTIETVNARDIHAFLEVDSRFNDWIVRRIKQYGFLEEIDFTAYSNVSTDGTFASTDYFVTLGMAKELSMVEHNDKGRQARRYFLRCEEEALRLLQQSFAFPPPPQLPSIQERLNDIRLVSDFLKELQEETARDRLMFADMARTILVHAQSSPTAAAQHTLPSPEHFDIADRVKHLGYALTRQQQASLLPVIGKAVAQEYRNRYDKEPESTNRFVDGKVRPVRWYTHKDTEWLDTVIQVTLAQHGVQHA